MKNKISSLFGNGSYQEDHNVLYTALHNAARANYDEPDKVYTYIENTPRTSLICEIMEEIDELGYEIKKK